MQNQINRVIILSVSVSGQHFIGMSPSGKAPDFVSGIRRFKSCHPSQRLVRQTAFASQHDPLAQLAEQLPFKQWVWSSNLQRVTKRDKSELFRSSEMVRICFLLYISQLRVGKSKVMKPCSFLFRPGRPAAPSTAQKLHGLPLFHKTQ